jgi:hypothetical protein
MRDSERVQCEQKQQRLCHLLLETVTVAKSDFPSDLQLAGALQLHRHANSFAQIVICCNRRRSIPSVVTS